MNVQYKELIINIMFKDILDINNKKINIFDVTIVKNGNSINLGNFYSETNISDNIEYFIKNIDKIIFEQNRYIGDDTEIIDYLTTHDTNNVKIRDIYLDYINIKMNSPEYKKYSRFLEMYFCNHEITDDIRKIFLEKENKNILDYDDIDNVIKSEFIGSIGSIREERDHEINTEKYENLKIKLNILNEEINLIENIVRTIEEVLVKLNENSIMLKELGKLNIELKSMNFLDRRKIVTREKISKLKAQLDVRNLFYFKKIISEKINEYALKYNDSYGFNILVENVSFGDLLTIVKGVYKNKKKLFNSLKIEYLDLEKEIGNYQECNIDISDLYERLESNKVKEQV